jgi:uncharacterized protein
MATELLHDLYGEAEAKAIKVFAEYLEDLLMAAPAGPKPTLGLDPGSRANVKVCVFDETVSW